MMFSLFHINYAFFVFPISGKQKWNDMDSENEYIDLGVTMSRIVPLPNVQQSIQIVCRTCWVLLTWLERVITL